MVLDVRSFMESSFGTLSSQLKHHATLLPESARPTGHVNQAETGSLLPRDDSFKSESPLLSDDKPELWLSKLAAHHRQTLHMSHQEAEIPDTLLHPTVTITSALRQPCPPNCRCQCHVTSHSSSPAWAMNALGMLLISYKSLPLLGKGRCDIPLCKASPGSAFRIHYCFPQWAVARALQISMSWGSLADAGASIFLKIPRTVRGYFWVNLDTEPVADVLRIIREGSLRPTDILVELGQTALTVLRRPKYRLIFLPFFTDKVSDVYEDEKLGPSRSLSTARLRSQLH